MKWQRHLSVSFFVLGTHWMSALDTKPESQVASGPLPLASIQTIADAMIRGDRAPWDQALDGLDQNERWLLLEQVYMRLGDRKHLLAGALNEQAVMSKAKIPSRFAAQLYADFLPMEAPLSLKTPFDKRGWGGHQEIILSPKYQMACAIMGSGDPATLKKIWNDFPSLSQADRQLLSQAANNSEDLEQVLPLLNAMKQANSMEVKTLLLESANRIVVRALDDPSRREVAKQAAQSLVMASLALPFLTDKLEKQEQSR